jgi:3-hydroxybutyryl-CoA dehydratase
VQYEVGKSFDQIEVGEKASFSKTICETDICFFAAISGDFNPAHVNEAYSKVTKFKTRVAHGFVAESLCAPVVGMKLPGPGTVVVDHYTRYLRPTFIGDTITATAEVQEKIEEKKRVRLKLTWLNQNGDLVCEGWAVVIPPKP